MLLQGKRNKFIPKWRKYHKRYFCSESYLVEYAIIGMLSLCLGLTK